MKFIKSFLKYYLPTLIFIGALGIFTLVYMFKNHTPILMFVFGKARVHSNLAETIVKRDGTESPNIKVFILDNGNKFLVYNPDSKGDYGVIIVDKAKFDIASTNFGENYYDLLFGQILFQTDGAYAAIYASHPKWELNPKLEISEQRISYITKKLQGDDYIDVNHEIIFKGK